MPTLPNGQELKFFHRSKFMRTAPTRRFGLVSTAPLPLPPHPAVFGWRNGIDLPILGNDTVGDCFYAAAAHITQIWCGNHGVPASFDQAKLVARYLQISGGDNGLGDDQIFPEFKSGIIGPNGPHKIFDNLTVDTGDLSLVDKAIYFGVGVFFTASLADAWIQSPHPGDVWDVAPPNDANGHAMVISGKGGDGNYLVETWGFDKQIRITPQALQSCRPEIVVCVSPDQFAANGYAPCGIHYSQARTYWQSYGGILIPDAPYPPPTPIPQPAPIVPPAPVPVPVPTPTPPPAPSPNPVPPVPSGKVSARDLNIRIQSAMRDHSRWNLLTADTATAVAATVIHANWTNLTAPN